jgi:hypothetical protein
MKHTLDGRLWNCKTGLLHPVGGHGASDLDEGGADGPSVLRTVVVQHNLLDLHEVSSKPLLVNTTFDISSPSMVSAPPCKHDDVEDSPLEFDVYLAIYILICLQKP